MPKREADVIYTTTDEEETIKLDEVIKDKSIAFSEHASVPACLAVCWRLQSVRFGNNVSRCRGGAAR